VFPRLEARTDREELSDSRCYSRLHVTCFFNLPTFISSIFRVYSTIQEKIEITQNTFIRNQVLIAVLVNLKANFLTKIKIMQIFSYKSYYRG